MTGPNKNFLVVGTSVLGVVVALLTGFASTKASTLVAVGFLLAIIGIATFYKPQRAAVPAAMTNATAEEVASAILSKISLLTTPDAITHIVLEGMQEAGIKVGEEETPSWIRSDEPSAPKRIRKV